MVPGAFSCTFAAMLNTLFSLADSFFSRCPLRAELIPGQEYRLKVTVESLQGRGNLGLFFSDGGQLCIGLEYLD